MMTNFRLNLCRIRYFGSVGTVDYIWLVLIIMLPIFGILMVRICFLSVSYLGTASALHWMCLFDILLRLSNWRNVILSSICWFWYCLQIVTSSLLCCGYFHCVGFLVSKQLMIALSMQSC
ncbi:hypothetical protein KC19_9G042700 [Ceratodon purpureus]|uniref:Uncharacterized protein n=1 Tax=Ceratodon purpureus TaxID=3225 RepID=A0A8T0GSP0_CERPU|nr:hypothetical protein KC19_9G042700 [Ceratodon purpureus]